MDDFIAVANVSDIESGSIKTVDVKGKHMALANVNGEFFAVADACTHAGCSLGADGALDGNTVVCGCHGAKFDVTNGKVLALPATKDVARYEVKVEGGKVYIKI